jgi:Protein of unknown function (DUF2786)
MKNEDIKRKIQKALNLSRDAGASVDESQNVLLAAQRLAIKHGLDMEELGDLPPKEAADIRHVEIKSEGLFSWWRAELMKIIGNNFKCEHYRSPTGKYKGKAYFRLVMVGFPDDVEIAVAVYKHAEKSIQHHARTYIRKMGRRILAKNKAKFRDEFIRGYLDGMARKFRDQVAAEKWELAIVKDALVLYETSPEKGFTKYEIPLPDPVSSDANAYNKGFKIGRDYTFPAGSIES